MCCIGQYVPRPSVVKMRSLPQPPLDVVVVGSWWSREAWRSRRRITDDDGYGSLIMMGMGH